MNWEICLKNIVDAFSLAVTVLIISIPEGLPVAVTISLAFSFKHMQKDNLLICEQSAMEKMAKITEICMGKTGSLTTKKMDVKRFWIQGKYYI